MAVAGVNLMKAGACKRARASGPAPPSFGAFRAGRPSAALNIYQEPGANAVAVMKGVRKSRETLAERFPPGVHFAVAADRTTFVTAAIHEMIITLAIAIAIALVIAVTYLFLQQWRTTLIPCLAIPVSLVGTYGPMIAFGFSLNTLSLLGLVLAVGLVVDDAIVAVENCTALGFAGGSNS